MSELHCTMINTGTWRFICGVGWMLMIFRLSEGAFDVDYEGKTYVPEGSPFNITCIRSAYGSPKWYKNGLIIDPLTTDFSVEVIKVSTARIIMGLSIQKALWQHRGSYKCDSLSNRAHKIEIVPSTDTDQKLRTVEKGRQKKVELEPGKKLEVLCEKEEHDAFPINWYKDGRRLQEVEEQIEMKGRILRILHANESDTGDYICIFEEKGQSYLYADHQGSRTWVTYGAHVQDFPHQIRPILGMDWSLECRVQGFPTPRIVWFVDGIEMKYYVLNDSRYSVLENDEGMPNAIFSINNVTNDDNHIIMCIADNVDGFDQAITRLAVRENALFTNEEYPGSGVVLVPGSELILSCNFSDRPLITFQWFKDGQPLNITPESRFHLDPPTTNNVLRIENALDSDCGNYSCISSEGRAVIAVRSGVKIGPLDHSRNVVQGQNIVLVCNITQGFPLPILKWYKDGQELNISDPRVTLKIDSRGIEGSELVIADANFDDRAEYTCNATNEVDSANVTILVRVKDKYAALWPFLGICAEVAVLCTIIFIYEKRRQKPDFDESETEHNTENKNIPDQDEKSRDVRQRK